VIRTKPNVAYNTDDSDDGCDVSGDNCDDKESETGRRPTDTLPTPLTIESTGIDNLFIGARKLLPIKHFTRMRHA